jgi:hypothetical protein
MFHTKTRRLVEYLEATLTPGLQSKYPGGFEFLYPNAPLCLSPVDFSENSAVDSEISKAWAWWQTLDDVSEYHELPATMLFLYKYIKKTGPVDGVIGFSQGGAMALMFASWCEARTRVERRQALADQHIPFTMEPPQDPLKFVLCFSGFRGTMKHYEGFYNPKIQTPTLYITAALDTLVSGPKSAEAISSCENVQTITHQGSHYVPCHPRYLSIMATFVEGRLLGSQYSEGDMYGPNAYYGSDSSLESPASSTSSTSTSRSSSRRLQYRKLGRNHRRVYLVRKSRRGIE